MVELLEPYRGQRGRVARLLMLDGQRAPKFGRAGASCPCTAGDPADAAGRVNRAATGAGVSVAAPMTATDTSPLTALEPAPAVASPGVALDAGPHRIAYVVSRLCVVAGAAIVAAQQSTVARIEGPRAPEERP
jgi:hypothetical protein